MVIRSCRQVILLLLSVVVMVVMVVVVVLMVVVVVVVMVVVVVVVVEFLTCSFNLLSVFCGWKWSGIYGFIWYVLFDENPFRCCVFKNKQTLRCLSIPM